MSTLPWRSGSGSSHIIVNLKKKAPFQKKKKSGSQWPFKYFLSSDSIKNMEGNLKKIFLPEEL